MLAKIRRAFVLTLAWFVLVGSAAMGPALIAASGYGEEDQWPIDLARIIVCGLGAAAGAGVLFHREWARRLLVALLLLNLARVIHLLFFMRSARWDLVGFLIFAGLLTIYAFVCTILLRTRDLTPTPPASSSLKRRFFVIATTLAALGLPILMLVEHEELQTTDIPPVHQDLEFLAEPRTWTLEKLLPSGYDSDGYAEYSSRPVGRVLVRSSGELVVLEGVPAFRNLDVRFDTRRNTAFFDDAQFQGSFFETAEFLWKRQNVRGVTFKREFGRITGRVVVAQRDDGKMFIVSAPLDVFGKPIEAFYLATPDD